MRKSQGGHSVSDVEIHDNYHAGIHLAGKFIDQFDKVLILENAVKTKADLPVLLAEFNKGQLVKIKEKLPDWAKLIIPQRKELIKKQRTRKSRGRKL